jgi:hypothetical protein
LAQNIQIQHGNFTVGRTAGVFYTMDHVAGTLIEKLPNGNTQATYTLETSTKEVLSLQFDGYYFWSLDRPIINGFRVRKWEIGTDTIVRVISDYLFSPDIINSYDVNSIAVEAYTDSLDNQYAVGTTTFDVVDGQVITIGDNIIVGPSTAVAHENDPSPYSFTTVIGKTGNTLTVSPALSKLFSPGDSLVFSRKVFAFSDVAPGNLDGALYTYRTRDGQPLSLDVSNLYGGVRASTFFQNKLMFIRGSEVIWLNPDSHTIFKSQAISNATASRSGYVSTYDLAGFSNTLYRLEQERVYYSETFNRWETENWAPLYNYNTDGIIPEVYFVSVKAQPQVLHRFVSTIDPDDLDSEVTITVLDQFRTPVFNRTVNLTSTGGPLSSNQETTDSNGQVRVTYTANSFIGEVTITAEVI